MKNILDFKTLAQFLEYSKDEETCREHFAARVRKFLRLVLPSGVLPVHEILEIISEIVRERLLADEFDSKSQLQEIIKLTHGIHAHFGLVVGMLEGRAAIDIFLKEGGQEVGRLAANFESGEETVSAQQTLV